MNNNPKFTIDEHEKRMREILNVKAPTPGIRSQPNSLKTLLDRAKKRREPGETQTIV